MRDSKTRFAAVMAASVFVAAQVQAQTESEPDQQDGSAADEPRPAPPANARAARPPTAPRAAPQPPPYPYPYPPPYPYGYPPPGAYPPPYGYPPPGYPPPYPGYPPPYAGYPPRAASRGPKILPYREGSEPPAGYHLEERTRRGPIIAGSITLGTLYLLSTLVASAADYDNASGWLLVPALGPWLTLAQRDDCSPTIGAYQSECAGDRTAKTLLVIDGLGQSAGAALLVWGMSSKKMVYVRDDVSVLLTPSAVGSNGYGLAARGTF